MRLGFQIISRWGLPGSKSEHDDPKKPASVEPTI
jgi:hypothetical protein